MNKLTHLNPGDKLITQNPETHKYEHHTVTGNTGTGLILNGGAQLLWETENVKEDETCEIVYVLQNILTSYDENHYDRHMYEDNPNTQVVDIIRLFPQGTNVQAARDYLNTLNKLQRALTPHAYEQDSYVSVGSRTYKTDTEDMAQARLNPHTITKKVANKLQDALFEEVETVTKTYLQGVAALQQNTHTLFVENHDKLKAYHDSIRNEEAQETGSVHILDNPYLQTTMFGFVTGSLVTFELSNFQGAYTLQVADGSHLIIRLVDKDGNPAGKFFTECEHIDHDKDGMALEDLYGEYDEYNVCYSCRKPEWTRSRLLFASPGSNPITVASYDVKLNTTFKKEQARQEVHEWQVQNLRNLAKRYNHLTVGVKATRLTPLHLAALSLYPSDTKTLDVVENVVKDVNRHLKGAEGKATSAKDKFISEAQEALNRYLTIKDTGVAF